MRKNKYILTYICLELKTIGSILNNGSKELWKSRKVHFESITHIFKTSSHNVVRIHKGWF